MPPGRRRAGGAQAEPTTGRCTGGVAGRREPQLTSVAGPRKIWLTFTRAEPRARSRRLGRPAGSGGLGPSIVRSPEEEVLHWTVNVWVRWRSRPRRVSPGAVAHRALPRSVGTQRRRSRKLQTAGPLVH